jgi:hypothetical protein
MKKVRAIVRGLVVRLVLAVLAVVVLFLLDVVLHDGEDGDSAVHGP